MSGRILFAFALVFSFQTYAEDLGFRFKEGKCLNEQGEEGLNPQHFGQCGDLKRKILGRFSFDGMDFRGSDFEGADLSLSTFKDANLEGSNLSGANLSGVDLFGANLTSANLESATLTKAILTESNLSGAKLKGANLKQADLSFVSLKGMDLSEAIFDQTNLESSDLSETVFTGVTFKEITANGANFKRSTFTNSKFEKGLYVGADFTATKFKDSEMNEINAGESTWLGAELEGVKGRKNSFKDSQLGKFVAKQSELKECDFTRAILTESQFIEASVNRSVFVNANLTQSQWMKSILRSVDWTRVTYDQILVSESEISKRSKKPFTEEEAIQLGFLIKGQDCNPKYDVEFEDRCYYLDGSGGKCSENYELAPQSILAEIGEMFKGKDYFSKVSSNCCIWHSEFDNELQDYGFQTGCNSEGPFTVGPTLNGAGCNNSNNKQDQQLTLCRTID